MRTQSSERIRRLILFAMLGALMLLAKIVFEPIPNVHPLAALVVTYTVVYRKSALIPIYVYVLLQGLLAGFNLWWIPYTYVWTVLWALTMLVPKKAPLWAQAVIYPLLCALHGILFGALYAPAQALMFGLNFSQMIAWIIAGLPFDAIHAVGNFAAGFLVLPVSRTLKKLEKK